MFTRKRTMIVAATGALVVLTMISTPAMAGGRDRGRGGKAAAHHRASNRDHRSSRSRFGLHLSFASRPSVVLHGHTTAHRARVVHPVRYCTTPGHYESHWVPPAYETRYDECGNPYTVKVQEGYYEQVWVPAQYVTSHGQGQHHGGHGPLARAKPRITIGAHVRF